MHLPTSSPSISWVMHSPRLLHAEADHPANLDRLQRHPQMWHLGTSSIHSDHPR